MGLRLINGLPEPIFRSRLFPIRPLKPRLRDSSDIARLSWFLAPHETWKRRLLGAYRATRSNAKMRTTCGQSHAQVRPKIQKRRRRHIAEAQINFWSLCGHSDIQLAVQLPLLTT